MKAVPKDKAQRNFTDPESRIMPSKDGFVQAYNVQSVVDEKCQIIVATEVTNSPNDAGVLRTLVEMAEQNTGRVPKKLSADAGYYAQDDVVWLEERGVMRILRPDVKNTARSRYVPGVGFRSRIHRSNGWHGS